MNTLELTSHILCVITIVILSVLGSGFSIYFYANKKPITVGRIFIIALAMLDIFASDVVTPQIVLHEYYSKLWDYGITFPMDMLLVVLPFTVIAYLLILTSIAVDRAIAVLRPFAYKPSRKRTIIVIASAVIFSLTFAIPLRSAEVFFGTKGSISKVVIMILMTLSFATLFISYSLILYTLRRQRIKVGARPILQGGVAIDNTTNLERSGKDGVTASTKVTMASTS